MGNEHTLIFAGGAVKAISERGKVGGYLVVFSDEHTPDLSGEFFDRSTDFYFPPYSTSMATTVLFDHGLDPTIKRRKLGRGVLEIKETGLWIEAQLLLRDEYEKAIFELVRAGKLSWSSGSASHLVSRTQKGKAKFISEWPVVESSLTPTPAEFRAEAVALKSYEIGRKDLTSFLASAGSSEFVHPAVAKRLVDDFEELRQSLTQAPENRMQELTADWADLQPLMQRITKALAKDWSSTQVTRRSRQLQAGRPRTRRFY